MDKHMEKKHPEKKEIAETEIFPDDIANIVTRLCGFQEMLLFCGICLRREIRGSCSIHDVPYIHSKELIVMSTEDRDKLKWLRESNWTLENALKFRDTGRF